MSHFVYLYRDQNGKPFYVGYGQNSQRALSHINGTHNPVLEKLLQGREFKLEVAGPFENAHTARAVETALISALKFEGLANIAQGHDLHRFRPIGVPVEFASRWELPPLSRDDLDEVLSAHASPQFLCVLIQPVDFGDGRGEFDPASLPDDDKLLTRIIQWWPLASKKKIWSQNPLESPVILLATHSKPDARFVIASVWINTQGWPDAEEEQVPILATSGLDAAGLRGRRIAPEAGLRFNQGGMVLFP